jgi:hypothetical protein
MVLVKGDQEPGQLPTEEMLDEMGKYNEELVKAGVMLDGNGLHPSAEGARVSFDADGKPTVTDGPFAESKELVAGYWILQVKSLDEAIEWIKRAPFRSSEELGEAEVEIRPVFELDEFGDSPAMDRHRAIAEELEKKRT